MIEATATRRVLTVACLFSVLTMCSFGCKSSGSGKGMQTATKLEDAAAQIERARGKVDQTLKSMNSLVDSPQADPRSQFTAFKKNVDELETLAKKASKEADLMQDQGDEYFARWEKDLKKVKNEEMRSAGEGRRAEREAQFKRIQSSYQQVKSTATPFMQDLRDIRTSLSADLSPKGIESMKSFAARANEHFQPLNKALGDLSADFRAFGVEVAPKH